MFRACQIVRMVGKDSVDGQMVTWGFESFKHWHDDIEFVYIKAGSLRVEVDRQVFHLTAGELLVIPSNGIHTFLSCEEGSRILVSRLPVDHLPPVILDYYKQGMITRPTADMVRVYQEAMQAEFGVYNEIYLTAKLTEFSILMLTDKSLAISYFPVYSVEASDTALIVQDFIEKHLHEKLTLGMLADHLGISEGHCSKLLKEKTKLNFLELVNERRVREAEVNLKTTDLQMAEICYAAGFSSIQSFNRNFKKHRGISPSEYRKKMAG